MTLLPPLILWHEEMKTNIVPERGGWTMLSGNGKKQDEMKKSPVNWPQNWQFVKK
jgi:hypothetical protein